MIFKKALFLACTLFIGTNAANAASVTYDFTWTGSGTTSLVGFFTATDSNNDNIIRDLEVTELTFEGFDNGVSLGVTSGAQSFSNGPSGDFNFNFDLIAGTFLDGNSVSGDGQLWNRNGPGLGFFDGGSAAGIVLNGGAAIGGFSFDPQNYTATLRPDVAAVPLPAALPLAAAGMGLLGLVGWRRRQDS